MDPLQARLVSRIKQIAKERRIPITHVADRAGVSRSHFFDVMKGAKEPGIAWVGKIAAGLEVDPGELISRSRRT